MRGIFNRHNATSSASSTTDSDTIHFPRESDEQASIFSDVLARVESRFNHFQSVIHNPSSRVAAISAIYKEMDAARQLLCSLRNALAPISLLPPEVLAQVFHCLALEEPACSGKQDLGWIRATHVCRFWRQVALDDSSLWARISGVPTNTEWISEMLIRARNASLDIDIDFGVAPSLELLPKIPPHLSHTRKLRLYLHLRSLSKPYADSVRGICSQEAPALEHFELGGSAFFPVTFQELGGTTLFNGQAPRLRMLILSQVLIPWSLIPRGQLTQLNIYFDGASIADDPSYGDFNQLVDLLINSSGLEVLVLGCRLPSQLTQFPHAQTIHLPRLRLLRLGGASSRIANLFKALKLPSSTKLHFHCVSGNPSTRNGHLLLTALSAHFQGPASVEFKNLSVTVSRWGRSMDVTASTSLPKSRNRQFQDIESDMEDDDDDDDLVLSFDGLPKLGHWSDLLESVCTMLPISNLEFLSVAAPYLNRIDSVNWARPFKRCTQVTTVQAFGRGTSSLVRAQKLKNMRPGRNWEKRRRDDNDSTLTQPARNTAAYVHAPVFPKLTYLSLKWLDFDDSEYSSGIVFDIIANGLRQRKVEYRAPLKMLRIDNCTISAKRANALRRLVQGFEWDGDEGYRESEVRAFWEWHYDEPEAWWEDPFFSTERGVFERVGKWWDIYLDG